MENASAAILDAVRKSMAAVRIAVGAATVDREWLTCAERLHHEGYLRREATGEATLALSRQVTPIKKIFRTTGHSRKLVRTVLRSHTPCEFPVRVNALEFKLIAVVPSRICLGTHRRSCVSVRY